MTILSKSYRFSGKNLRFLPRQMHLCFFQPYRTLHSDSNGKRTRSTEENPREVLHAALIAESEILRPEYNHVRKRYVVLIIRLDLVFGRPTVLIFFLFEKYFLATDVWNLLNVSISTKPHRKNFLRAYDLIFMSSAHAQS